MNEFYALKMQNPTPVDLYYSLSFTSNVTTGDNTPTKSKCYIQRAVVTSLVSKYRMFAPTDGLYQRTDTLILVDWRDLASYTKNSEDYFVISGKRYDIVTVEYIANEGYVFVVREVQNTKPYQEITLNLYHVMEIQDNYDQS